MVALPRFSWKPEQDEVTICTQCVHFKNLEPHSARKDVWYNHLCQATPLPKKVDPYDGKMKPCAVNDLGREHFTENEFQYCRELNDGKCPKFHPR